MVFWGLYWGGTIVRIIVFWGPQFMETTKESMALSSGQPSSGEDPEAAEEEVGQGTWRFMRLRS